MLYLSRADQFLGHTASTWCRINAAHC